MTLTGRSEKNREKPPLSTEAQLAIAIEALSEHVVLFDDEDRIVLANRAWRDLNREVAECTKPGTRFEDHLRALLERGLVPEAHGREEDWLHERMERHLNPSGPFEVTRQNGRWIRVFEQRLTNGGIILIISDITESKRMEQALRESEARFRAVFDNSPVCLSLKDTEGRYLLVNKHQEDWLGYPAEEIIGRSAGEFIRNRTTVENLTAAEKLVLETGEVVEREVRVPGPDRGKPGGNIFDRILIKFPVKSADGSVSAIGTAAIDITDRNKTEETVARQNEELRKQDKELIKQNERFNAALENLSQGVSMFDGEQRLVVCNERFGSIYGLAPEQVKPGTTLREILNFRVASGVYDGESAKAYIEKALAEAGGGTFVKKARQLSDGRIIEITRHPMSGGGWVTTHEDITELRRIEARMAHMAHHDALTGLPNRVLLRERIEEELKRTRRGETFALLCLDLDQFKNVNDTLGHPAGDELLKSVAERLRGCVRETNLVARLGGDEFAMIQTAIEQKDDIAVLASRICDAIRIPFNIEDHEVIIETSIGIAIAPDDSIDPDELLKMADMALYRAKAEGPGAYCFFEPELEASVKKRQALGLDLRKALSNDELQVYFQPLVNLDENKVSGFEALLRWTHPELGTVPPDTFIPLAEQMGLINTIGEWVLRQACLSAATWPEGLKVAVNISPVQFKSRNLVQAVIGALAGSGLSSSRLELEITESVLLQDDRTTLTKLHRMRDLGVRVSMDDFGTGYSSLSYLTSFPFDKIKIDASFVSGLCKGGQDAGILRAIVSLASNLGVTTTAEGVETEGQLEIIRREGCAEAQGYLFSHPMPAGEISDFLSHYPEKSERIVSAA